MLNSKNSDLLDTLFLDLLEMMELLEDTTAWMVAQQWNLCTLLLLLTSLLWEPPQSNPIPHHVLVTIFLQFALTLPTNAPVAQGKFFW